MHSILTKAGTELALELINVAYSAYEIVETEWKYFGGL